MRSNNSNGSRAASARGFMAFFAIVLAMGLGLAAFPEEAQPFAYVTNSGSNSVSVIDTATNTVVTTLAVGSNPFGVAVSPDGKHAYVTGGTNNAGIVAVIDTATNTVEAATLAVGIAPSAVAVTPDGKHAYVTNFGGRVSVNDTATNTVEAATLAVASPGRDTRLCHEFRLRHGLDDRHRHQHGGVGHDRGGEFPTWRGHHSAARGRPLPRLQRQARDRLGPQAERGSL